MIVKRKVGLLFLIATLSLILTTLTGPLINKVRRMNETFEFDSHGIPLCQGRYNPVTISQYAHERADSERLLLIANWLAQRIKKRGDYGVLEYDYPFPLYGLEPPWVSALANAEAIKVFITAFFLTGDSSYLDDAQILLRAFLISVDSGGLTLKEGPDMWWYAEYARPDPPMVLNGMMIVLLRLNEFYSTTGDTLAISLFRKGLNSLCHHLDQFDFHGLSRYDLVGRVAGYSYHSLHLKLLRELYGITGCAKLKRLANRWRSGELFPYRILIHPGFKELLLLGFNLFLAILFVVLVQKIRKILNNRR